ncbi:MFS transporter [Microtetraspora niveoalba]|uniref:MFS transporter n=1 Tax=Microtetraspora niveoalba TaxID=46175 RepID=UPI00082E3D66|nr:MFS transporter [Microtetraspora niveoalba]
MVGVTNLLDTAFFSVLVPVWAQASGNGPTAIGLNNSVFGAVAVAGSLVAAAAGHRMPRRAVFFTGYLLAGAPRFLVLAADAPMWAVLAVFAVSGLGVGFLNPILGAILPAGLRREWREVDRLRGGGLQELGPRPDNTDAPTP